MLRKWNRFLAFLLAFALVTTTFGSDFASAKVYAVEGIEDVEPEDTEGIGELSFSEEVADDAQEPEEEVTEEVTGTPETAENTEEVVQNPEANPEETPEAIEGETPEEEITEEVTDETAEAEEPEAETVVEEKIVKVTYKATKGGRVSVSSEEVNINDEEAAFQGATAEAWNDKYTFVDWTDAEGNQVSTDSTFVPSDVTEDATFTANFLAAEDIETAMPELSAEDVKAGDLIVTVSADAGLFPEGTEIVIEPVDDNRAVELAEQSLGEGNVKQAKAVDIKFVKDEQELQPADAKYVHVSITLEEAIESSDAVMLHEHDGEVKEISDAAVTSEGAEFDVNRFSVFIYADTDNTGNVEKKVVKYRFYAEDDKSEVFNEQPLKNGDTLVNPGMPKLGNNREFLKWQIATTAADGTVTYKDADFTNAISDITEDTPDVVDVVPLIQGTYYTTFYGEDGEIFHVASKVATGSEEATVNISEVPDYTPTEDIMNCIGWKDANGKKYSFTDSVDAKKVTELWPDITKAYWVRFDKNLSGATFTGAQRIADGAKLSTIQSNVTGENAPWCNGYEFMGWATTATATTPDVDWNLVINSSTVTNNEYKLYAVWKANKQTTYTVVFWKQNINDKYDETNPQNKNVDAEYTWDFAEAVRLQGETGTGLNTNIVNTALNNKTRESGSGWKIARMDQANYEGFQYLKNDLSDGATISGNGDTVVNVYYTRKVVTLTFNYNDTQYIEETVYTPYSNNETIRNNPNSYTFTYGMYGLVDDEYVPVTYTADEEVYFVRYNNQNQEHTGPVYYRTSSIFGSQWHRVDDYSQTNSSTTYYRSQNNNNNNRLVRKTRDKNVVWRDSNGNVYNGAIYGKTEIQKVTTEVMKMLFGQTLSQNDYTWPQKNYQGKYFQWEITAGDTGYMTVLDAVFKDYTFSAGTFNTPSRTVHFFKEVENEDGTVGYEEADTAYANNSGNFVFTNKYEGYELAQYSTDGGRTKQKAVVNGETSATDICIYFNRKEYTLTFFDVSPLPDDNHAEHEVTHMQVKYKQKLSSYAGTVNTYGNYSAFGYENSAWYQDKAGTQKFNFDSTMPASNLAVYGCWEAVDYKLHYNPNEGELHTVKEYDSDGYGITTQSPGERIFKTELIDTSFVSRDGWDIVGWYYQITDGSGNPTYGDAFPYEPIKEDTTIIAKWRFSDNISVVFDGNEHGSFSGSDTYTDGKLYASDASFVAAAAPDEVEVGWTFIGWKVEGDASGTVYTPNAVINITDKMIDADNAQVVAKAQYIENGGVVPGQVPTFIQYHTNFGADQVKLVTEVSEGKPLYVNNPITALSFAQAFPGVTNAHYTFAGWSTSASATEAWLNAGETYTLAADEEGASVVEENGNKTYTGNDLYAVWVPEVYTVTFNLAGGQAAEPENGQVDTEVQNVTYMDTAVEPTVEITRTGHTFKGWTIAKDGAQVDYDFATPVTENIVLNAKWELNQYTVKFVSNGDTNPKDQTVDHGATATQPDDPEREGYIFEKWYSDEALTTEYNFSTPVTSNITLYGAWKFDGSKVVIKAKDLSQEYNGVDLVGDYEVIAEGVTLPEGFEVYDVTYKNDDYKIKNVGSKDYQIDKFSIRTTDATVKSVTEITKQSGTLTVTALTISVTSAGETWKFDGQFHENGNITATFKGQPTSVANGELNLTTVNGEVITFTTTAKRMLFGKEPNVITVSGPEGYEGNYNIIKNEGELKITLQGNDKLVVTGKSHTFGYDGNPHGFTSEDGFDVTNKPENFDQYYTVVADVSGTVTNVSEGKVPNVISNVQILDNDGNPVDLEEIGLEIKVVNGEIDIAAREVVVQAVSASKTYGDEDPELTATVTGLLNNDTITYEVTREDGEGAGTYTITPAGDEYQGNYHVTYETSTFTILAKAVTVTADDKSKTYGAEDPELTWTADGLVDGEDKSVLDVEISRVEGEDVGEYTITPSGDKEQGNYTVTYETGTFTIGQKTVTVTAVDNSKTYGDPDPELTWTADGLAKDDDESVLDVKISRAEGEDVGEYTITPSGDAQQGNYTVAYVTGTFEITKKAVTITAEDKSKTYGDADPELTWTTSELGNNDTKDIFTVNIEREQGEDAGEYTVTPSGDAEQGNYTVTYETGTFTIDKKTVTITAENKNKTYGDADPELTWTTSELGNNDTKDIFTVSIDREQGEDAGEYTITPSGDAEQGNYTVTYETGTLTIDKKAVTVTPDNKSKKFRDADPELTATVTGLVDGDTVAYELDREDGEDVGTYTITASGDTEQGNYTVEFKTGNLIISEASVVVVVENKEKTYGDEDPELTAYVTFNGERDDSIEIEYDLNRAEGEDVGDYTITATGDTQQGNYTVEFGTGTLSINKKTVTVTADTQSKVYGADDPELTATVTGLVGNDSVEYDVDREEGEDVGTYVITPSGDAEQGNYDVVFVPANLTITKAKATVTAEAKTKTYGDDDPELTAVVTGLQNGDEDDVISYTLSRVEGEDIGTYTITPSGDAEQGNYDVVFETSTLTISKKGVVVTAQDATKVYGADDPELTAVVTGLENGDDESVISYTLSRVEGEDVGTYAITPAGDAVQGNYDVTFVPANLTITKAKATVTAEGKSKVYGDPNPDLTAKVTGLVNDDDESVISYTLSREEGEDVGTYVITPSGDAVQGNYDVEFVPAEFEITKATVTVTADADSKVYGDEDPEFTATVTGLQNNDDESVISYKVTREGGENVGTYVITPAGDAVQGNYNVTFVTANFEITKAKATVTAESKTKTFGEEDPELTAVVSGLKNGDDESVINYTLSRVEGEDFGTYAITPAGDAEQGNYDVTYVPSTLTIYKKGVVVTAEGATKVYGDEDPEFKATVTGLENGDDESVISYTLSRVEGEDVGDYAITPTGDAVQGNYDVTFVPGTFKITKAAVTVTADAATKEYGSDDPEFTATVSGLQNDDDKSVISYTITRDQGDNIGEYDITPAGDAEQGNYDVTYVPAKLTITPATLTVTADAQSKIYGNEDPEFTVTYGGFKYNEREEQLSDPFINFEITREAGENVGTYVITPAGETEQGNYIVTYVPANLTIEARRLTLTAGSNTEHVFDGKPVVVEVADGTASELTEDAGLLTGHEFTYEFDVVNDEKLGKEVASNQRTLSGSQPVIIKEGTVVITADGEDVTKNYDITLADGLIEISSRGQDPYKVTISAEDIEITYDGQKHIYTTGYRVEGEGEKVSVLEMLWDAITSIFSVKASAAEGIEFTVDDNTYVLSGVEVTAEGKDRGSYPFAAEGTAKITMNVDGVDADVTDEFAVAYELGNLIIDPAAATVTVNNYSRNTSQSDPTFTAVVATEDENLQTEAEESISYTIARATGNGVGSYAITATPVEPEETLEDGTFIQGNFKVTYIDGTLTITSAPTPPPTDPGTPGTPTGDTPPAPAPAGTVLGARREEVATNDAAVLGARRGRTEDEANGSARVFAIVIAAAAAISLMLSGKKKEEE